MNTLWYATEWLVYGLAVWSTFAIAMVAVGAILCRCLRGHAASMQHAIWFGAVTCMLLVPLFSFWIPGVLPHAVKPTVPYVAAKEPIPLAPSVENVETPTATNLATASRETDRSVRIRNELPIAITDATAMESKSSRVSLANTGLALIAILWIVGVGVFTFRMFRVRKRLSELFRTSNTVRDTKLIQLVGKLAAEHGVIVGNSTKAHSSPHASRIELTVTRCQAGPLLCGLFPAKLLLPESLGQLSADKQEAAVLHEFAHLKRGDEWVRRYLLILRALFWFHPCVRYACDQVQMLAEKSCDDWVLFKGYLPSDYSQLLIRMGKQQSELDSTFLISCMAQSQIATRIRSILDPTIPRTPMSIRGNIALAFCMLVLTSALTTLRPGTSPANAAFAIQDDKQVGAGVFDWPQWGGSSYRNNVADGKNVPIKWDASTGENIRWSMPLGSSAYGGVVVANGKVFAGTNNDVGYIARYPNSIDLGVLLCFSEQDGSFLWQHSNPKLPTGRVHDWPNLGICSAPLVEGERLWYVTNRGQVVCLDTEGFRDNQNDGPYSKEESDAEQEADVIWVFDMMHELGVSQHNMANCSVTSAGDLLFLNTSHGVGEAHDKEPEKPAPSFLCLSKATGAVVWADSSPSPNILHGQWSSPAYAVLGGVPQVIFGGGDGYLYGFHAQGENGKSKLLWKFDCNPKDSTYTLSIGNRNHIVATPVVYDGLVYIAVGDDPEHGEGVGHLWCIDPTKRGDVSPTLVFNNSAPAEPVPHRKWQALQAKLGDFEKPNPNSALVWHYVGADTKALETTMHRTCSTVAIKNDLLFLPDFTGILHCLDAKTGKAHWTYDMFAACWASPLIVDERVYVCDEDGDVCSLRLSSKLEIIETMNVASSISTTPIVANDTLFIAANKRLWAIQQGANSKPAK